MRRTPFVALLVLALPAIALAESEAAKRLKKDLAQAGADEEKQADALARGAKADDADAAIAVLHAAANDAVAWKVRDAAITGLKALAAEPARAAIVQEVVKGSDPRFRAL